MLNLTSRICNLLSQSLLRTLQPVSYTHLDVYKRQGHIKAYSSLEVISRKRRMEGYNVLFPIGFDAFGLPTENYAVKTGTHPRLSLIHI